MTRPDPAAPAGITLRAVLLAGGHGRRAGGPKALQRIDGDLLWRVQARALAAVGCAHIVAVLHPRAWAESDPPAPADAACAAVRADPDAMPFASLLAALGALRSGGPLFVLPVDCPCPSRAVFTELWAAGTAADARGLGWDAVRPVHAGQGGHPVLLAWRFAEGLSARDPVQTRLDRELAQARAAGRVIDVAVRDAGVLANWNLNGTSR